MTKQGMIELNSTYHTTLLQTSFSIMHTVKILTYELQFCELHTNRSGTSALHEPVAKIYWTPKQQYSIHLLLHAGAIKVQYSLDDVNG